jgi:YbbR domain-containing protein
MEKLVQQIIGYLNTIPRPKNWVLKLIAFFFALFLWYFVAGEDKVDMNVSVPIEIVNLPRDLVVSNQFKKQIEVTVSGQRSLIRGLSSQNISRTVDLSSARPGKFDIENTPDSIPFPWGVSVLRLQPTTVSLRIDKLVSKELKVIPITTGLPPQGFDMVSVVLEPPSINITGPQSILDEEKTVDTVVIDVSNLKASSQKQVNLNLSPTIIDLIGESVVTANIIIAEKMIDQLVTDVPVSFSQHDDEQYQSPATTITVRAEIPYTVATGTKELSSIFVATVNPQTADSPDLNDFPVSVTVSPDLGSYKGKVRILGFTPKTVSLTAASPKRPVLESRKRKIKVNTN